MFVCVLQVYCTEEMLYKFDPWKKIQVSITLFIRRTSRLLQRTDGVSQRTLSGKDHDFVVHHAVMASHGIMANLPAGGPAHVYGGGALVWGVDSIIYLC